MMNIICGVWVYVNKQFLSTEIGLSTGPNFGLVPNSQNWTMFYLLQCDSGILVSQSLSD